VPFVLGSCKSFCQVNYCDGGREKAVQDGTFSEKILAGEQVEAGAAVQIHFKSSNLQVFKPNGLINNGLIKKPYGVPAATRRSLCGAFLGRPLLSSHFLPALAPQVGQGTPKICFKEIFMKALSGYRFPAVFFKFYKRFYGIS
jgi:hypothetical protein